MSKGLDKLKIIRHIYHSEYGEDISMDKDLDIIEKELKVLAIIEENLKYGYVFIGYGKDNKPLFQFADTKLYEEMKKKKKHITY